MSTVQNLLRKFEIYLKEVDIKVINIEKAFSARITAIEDKFKALETKVEKSPTKPK